MSTWRSRLFRYAAAGRPEHPVRQPQGGPARAAPARIGGAPATGRTPGAARAGDRPRPRSDASLTRSFLASAGAVGGHRRDTGLPCRPCAGAPSASSRRVAGVVLAGGRRRGQRRPGARRAPAEPCGEKAGFLCSRPARAGPVRRARPSGSPAQGQPALALPAAGPARPPHRWNEPPQALPHVRNQPCPPCDESFARRYGTTRVARPPARRPPAPVLSAGMPRRTPRLSRPRRGGM